MTPAEADNLLRFDGKRRGFYEVYFIEAQDAANSTGLWLRYTLRAPTDAASETVAEVWGIFFDRRDPSKTFALKQTVPFSMARVAHDRLHFQVAGCELTHSGCHGAIEKDGRKLAWDLTWDEGLRLVHFPYRAMYRGTLPKTKVMSPHFHARARGSYTADGQTQTLDDAPVQQSHLWGTKHAHRWIWAHTSTFKEDREAVFEGLTAQIKVGPVRVPELTMFALRYKGVDYVLNALEQMLRANESRTDSPTHPSSYFPVSRWIVGGGNEQLRFRGELWADVDRFVGVRYTDPDGAGLVCSHSKVANARLEILVRDGTSWRVADTLTSEGGTALEFVGREPDPRVRILV